jgi:ATP-dependent RNA helicase DeaD
MTSHSETSPAAIMAAINPALASALAKQGYETLTPVQTAALAADAEGRDLLVSAQTGSGKTVAFGLAIAPTLLGSAQKFSPKGRPLGLIIAPTRELALQVQRELGWLYAEAGVVTTSCVGGMDMQKERRALHQGAHLVVGTPGRLRDHITRGSLDLTDLRAVVLDEADEMLDLGFREDLEFILAATPEERRTLMFSATVPRPIAELAKTYQRDALRLSANAASERHADIEYQMVVAQSHERENAIINTLLYFDSGSAIVFCHTREAVKQLTTRLADRGFAVVTLSGELSQAERTNALQAMRDGRARVCVATDVAARGIDLPNLDLVIHADVPSKPDTLLHRSGRTGRAGRKGVCVLIVPVKRYSAALRVLDIANVTAITRGAPTAKEIDARNRALILETASVAPMPEASEQDMVGELLSRMSPEQLAAAYLRQQYQTRPPAEYISDTPLPDRSGRPRERDRDAARVPRERGGGERPRDTERGREDMSGAGWFTLSLGRKHRADPKWLLPMICKAGGVTKRDVGSIKISDGETRFEITAQKVDEFTAKVARDGSGEKGVMIAPVSGQPPRQAEKRPRLKIRSDRGEKLEPMPETTPPKPRPHQPARLTRPWNKDKPKTGPESRSSETRERRPNASETRKPGVKPWKGSAPKRGGNDFFVGL